MNLHSIAPSLRIISVTYRVIASTSMSTSALPTLRQLPHAVGTAGPQLPSALPTLRQLPQAVGTAGPQLPARDRSGHRWTSTWDLPSSVSTAGPQPGTFRAQWAPLDLNGQIECQKICLPWNSNLDICAANLLYWKNHVPRWVQKKHAELTSCKRRQCFV